MEVLFPHRVEYFVRGPVPVAELIGTLQAQQRLALEVGDLLERLVEGLQVERAELRVRSIEYGSLKEAFFIAVFLTFQKELQQEIPAMVEGWLGLPVDDRYDTLVTVAAITLMYYGADYAYRRFTDHLGSANICVKLDEAVSDLARLAGKSEQEIRRILDRHLRKKARLKDLAKAAIRIFRPSRNQNNAPLQIGERLIDSDTVAEVPNQVDLKVLDAEEHNVPFPGTRIEIRAKDHDHDGQGWGGIVHAISSARKPLRLYPNVPKDFLWTNDVVWADVLVTYRTTAAGQEVVRYHIMNVLDGPPSGSV